LAAVAIVAARSGFAPAAEASVAATVQASQVRFTLGAAQPIWGQVAEQLRLGAANLDSIVVPAVGTRAAGTVEEQVLQLTAKSDSASGIISLDPIVFPAGTTVVLSGGLSDTTLRFTLGDSLPVLPVSVDGPIEMIAGGPPEVLRFTLQRLQLVPSSTGMELELHPRQAQKTGLASLAVSHVSFARVDKIREGDQSKDVVTSTLLGGTIRVNGHSDPKPVASGSDLVLTDFTGTLSKVAIDTAGLTLSLEGTVHGIPEGLGGMPARWESWWTGKRWQTISLTLLWLGLMVWVVVPRRKRVP